MPKIHECRLTVPEDTIDLNGHVNNLEYIRWMQDAATAHSDAQGWTAERYKATGATWVVRSHSIEYLRPAFAGDEIIISTWVADFRRLRSRRKYKFVRVRDEAVLAAAQTDWVFIDLESGKPRRIPRDLVEAFPVVPPDEEP